MTRRLIEEAFPLKKVSEDSRHEKNVRHGHISTLHIWPARRPLAASRAAVLATLLPDPGDAPPAMQAEYARLAKSTDLAAQRAYLCRLIEGLTRWGTENGPNLQIARGLIRTAYGGRAPRVLDPFAGGGAIPLEAMRLGCEVTANDYNPVAWFILKCTLEYPQRLAGQTWPLPASEVAEQAPEGGQRRLMEAPAAAGDLAVHVRWWGRWVLERARADLAAYYPTIDGKPTVAYLWARTVPCPDPQCGATVPLLKTLWLCKKENKRRALRLVPNRETHRVEFEVWEPGPRDTVPGGTVAGGKATCPLCGVQLHEDYIKSCGHIGRMKAQMTCVVVDTPKGKEYRRPVDEELAVIGCAAEAAPNVATHVPHGLPDEPIDPRRPSPNARGLTAATRFGILKLSGLHTPRQLLALCTFVVHTRAAWDEMRSHGYPFVSANAVASYLALAVSRIADRGGSNMCHWDVGSEGVVNVFQRFALSMNWDFSEACPLYEAGGSYEGQVDWVCRFVQHALQLVNSHPPKIHLGPATDLLVKDLDAIVTDPPYYDAIPYADISDFFYVWIRRIVGDRYREFAAPLTPKVDELVQHAGRLDGDNDRAKERYEAGMAEALQRMHGALVGDGRIVVAFAHKQPDAWETLATALIVAGFCVTASWPIDTEMTNKAAGGARLASSIWLVCRKRPADAGVGRYAEVKRKMQERITERLRYFWDQGISGPDFVWAAVGPALESYSAYRAVRRMDGSPFTVGEFLREVRRLVTDFALGQILHGASTEGLDEWTRYYLMHRATFGTGPAPVGECILYAQGYGLDLNSLCGPRGILARGKARVAAADDEATEGEEAATAGGSGSDLRLLGFDERRRDDLGLPHPSGGLPMIDMLHYLLRLWQAGDTARLAAYSAEHGLSQNDLFWAVAQALVEQAAPGSRERSLLEALVAWGRGRDTQSLQPALL